MSTGLDVATDLMIIAIPIFLVSRIRLDVKTKLAVGSVFLTGGFITSFAIVRIIVTNTHSVHPEVSWLNLWSAIECSIAVTVCCMMVFKQLLTKRRKAGSSREVGGYGTPGYSGGSEADPIKGMKEFEGPLSSPSTLLGSETGLDSPPICSPMRGYPAAQQGRPPMEQTRKIGVAMDYNYDRRQMSHGHHGH
jgi:hypothetical protein